MGQLRYVLLKNWEVNSVYAELTSRDDRAGSGRIDGVSASVA